MSDYERIKYEPELIGELLDYNVGNTQDLSDRAEQVLELITRPIGENDKFSYILGRVSKIRVPLRGEDEVGIKELVEDYSQPDAIYRIQVK